MEEFIKKYGGYIIGFFTIPIIKLVVYIFHSTFKGSQHKKIRKEYSNKKKSK